MSDTKDFIYLSNERLNVEIAVPGTFYKGTRFDWNGFITQVTLDGKHTYCIPESLIPGVGSGGHGLCGEFGIHEPVGYDEAQVGECFPKIGVGKIAKCDDKEYDYFRNYDFEPYSTNINKSSDSIEFNQVQTDCNGYSFVYNKKISIQDSFMKIEYSLKNTGKKAVHTTEYCHNFVGIDNQKVGTDYILSFPFKPLAESLPPEVEFAGDNGLTWKDEGWDGSFCFRLKGYESENRFSWDLYNRASGTGLREQNDFEPARIVIWGMRHVVSTEIFKAINLEQGEEQHWTRNYEFYTKK